MTAVSSIKWLLLSLVIGVVSSSLLFSQFALAQTDVDESSREYLDSLGLVEFDSLEDFFDTVEFYAGEELPDDSRQAIIGILEENPSIVIQFLQPQFFSNPLAVVDTPGTVECFDYYNFGSVLASISTPEKNAVTGSKINFSVDVKNSNNYPVVDGTLYVKIFRQQEDQSLTFSKANHVVDQFKVAEGMVLAANSNKELSFEWTIPGYLGSGSYYAATYFIVNDRYNLSGLSFTDDIIGGSSGFVKINGEVGGIYFDKNNVSINDVEYNFIGPPLSTPKEGEVTISVPVVNESIIDHSAEIQWTVSKWDNLLKSNILDEYSKTVKVPAQSTVHLTEVVSANGYPVIMVEPKLNIVGETVSAMNVRFLRSDTDVPRINFPSVTDYPLKANENTSLFSCLHNAGSGVAVEDGELTLIVRDDQDNVVHSYNYSGPVTGYMMGVKDDFVPERDLSTFSIQAVLKSGGEIVEDVTLFYDCKEIDPSACLTVSEVSTNETNDSSKVVTSLLLLVTIIITGYLLLRYRQKKEENKEVLVEENNVEPDNDNLT